MPKNIVVLSDGTGQEGGKGHDTNVYKLFRMLEDRTPEQIVFYDQGLGTNGDRLAGMAFGKGIDANILQCYRFIFDHYQSGDKIFLFGFSRGAATVRSLASFIHYFGILPTSRPELIKKAYNIYKNRKRSYDKFMAMAENPEEQIANSNVLNRMVSTFNDALHDDLDKPGGASDQFVRQHPNQWVQIEFLGVWDTVPALGLVALPFLNSLLDYIPSWKHQYHNFKLRGSVKHACHALSIDDKRRWFLPSIWKEYDPDKTKRSNVEQVWFGGSHTDVGGGFFEAGFSDIALEWMVQKAFRHGIRLHFDSRPSWNFLVAPDPMDKFHDPQSALGKIYPSGERDKVWDDQAFDTFGPPRIHKSVLDRMKKMGKNYDPCILHDYPNETRINGWLVEEFAREAYRQWCKDVQRLKGDEELPHFNSWMSQLVLKKLMAESQGSSLIKEMSQLFLCKWMPEEKSTSETMPQLNDPDLIRWASMPINVTLRLDSSYAKPKFEFVTDWISSSEYEFLKKWAADTATAPLWMWMKNEWVRGDTNQLLEKWMPCPEEYTNFLAALMPEGSLLAKWRAENKTLDGSDGFAGWLKNNNYILTDFHGRKILVEKTQKVVFNPDDEALVIRHMDEQDVMTYKPAPAEQQAEAKKAKLFIFRDYDKKGVRTILDDSAKSEVLKYRMQRDERKLKQLERSERKEGLPGVDTNLDTLKYRILWDAARWRAQSGDATADDSDED